MMKNSIGVAASRMSALATDVARSRLLVAIGAGLCCSTGLFLTANLTLNQAGWIDPYVYAGYINDYSGLLERFGPTYYSERIAFIYPARAFTHLFGLEGGYFVFRFLALASAVAAVFAIGMRFYGYAAAILGAVWLSFTPWLPRSLLWTYCDGMAVVYLLIGAAFLFVPTYRRLACHAAASAAFALAVNCNLFVLAICGLLGPGWAFFYRREGIIWMARAIIALTVGFFSTYLALALLLYVQFPTYGFSLGHATIRSATRLLAGLGQHWYMPLSAIVWQQHNFTLLIPVMFAFAASPGVIRRSILARKQSSRMDFEMLVVSYLTSIICFSLVLHFGFHDAWLATPYYISYFLPGCVLTIVVLAGEAERHGGRIFGNAAVYGGTGFILFAWFAHPLLPDPAILSSWSLWLTVAAVIVGAALTTQYAAAASLVLVAGAVLLSLCLYQNSFYDIRIWSSRADAEWDVYHGAILLEQFVDANVPTNEAVRFWYARNDSLKTIGKLKGERLVGPAMTGPLIRSNLCICGDTRGFFLTILQECR